MSLRKRVQQIRDTDPLFFEKMVSWKESFDERRKLFWDKRIEVKRRDLMSGKVVKTTFSIEDACKLMWETYLDDDEWGLVKT